VKNPGVIEAVQEDPTLVLLNHYRLAVGGGGGGAIGFEVNHCIMEVQLLLHEYKIMMTFSLFKTHVSA
jgi:hypothetical protein